MTRAHMVVKKAFLSREFLMFLLSGGLAAAVNWGSRIVYNNWMPYSTAIIVAYITGMIVAFVLAKTFVFKASKHSTVRSAFFFLLVNLVAVLQTWVVSLGLAYYLLPRLGLTWHVRDLAHLVGVAVPVFTSYLGHRSFSFRR